VPAREGECYARSVGPTSRRVGVALLLGAASSASACAELTHWLTVPEKPLVAPTLDQPKAILFLEQDGAMTPFLCGAEGALARDKTCAGRVPVGAKLEAVGGEGLLVEKTAYRDCGAGESIEVSPKPSLKTVGLWSADGKATLERPRDASALPTGQWQRLAPKLRAQAAKELGAEPESMDLLGWVSAEVDGVAGPDLLLEVEAKPPPGTARDVYRAVIVEIGAEEHRLLPIATETSRRDPALALITAVDLDGDHVVEVVTGGDVWSVSKWIEGRPTDVASWYCYRSRPAAPQPSAAAL
jgi:hypothetical protein